jgi:hypothetical protein
LAILLTNLPSVAHSQSLGTIQREATTPTSRQKSNDRRDDHHHHHDDHDDGDSFLGSLLGVFLQGMFDSTTASSDTSIDFQYDDHVESTPSTNYFFAHYPYADGLGGYMFDEHLDVRPENRGQSIWFEYGNDFDQIQRYSMKFLLEDRSGWNFDGEWSFFNEETGGGNSDQLHVGDINVLFPLIQSESLTAYWGGGMNWLAAGGQEEYDWNSTFKFNAFPGQPWIVSGEVDYGELGSVHQVHTALSTGVNWKHGEVFIGYDYRKIGSTELHGPMLGGRLWW